MRIIGGKHRGRNLLEFEEKNVRPTSSMTRESLMNILQFKLQDACVLDLFAGTGGVGIEFLSRGAKKVFFCDSNAGSIRLIQKNLQLVKEDMPVIKTDGISFIKSTKEKFDIVYLDPPYDSDLGKRALEELLKGDILNKDGIIVLEQDSKKINDICYIPYDKRRYGRNELLFFKKGEN